MRKEAGSVSWAQNPGPNPAKKQLSTKNGKGGAHSSNGGARSKSNRLDRKEFGAFCLVVYFLFRFTSVWISDDDVVFI